MNVVRHDAPGEQSVPLAVEVQQGVLDNLRALGIPEPARSFPGVGVLIDSFAEFGAAWVVGRFLAGQAQFRAPVLYHIGGNRVRQPEGDGLDQARLVEVGEIPA
jgi:hypothetical protein